MSQTIYAIGDRITDKINGDGYIIGLRHDRIIEYDQGRFCRKPVYLAYFPNKNYADYVINPTWTAVADKTSIDMIQTIAPQNQTHLLRNL